MQNFKIAGKRSISSKEDSSLSLIWHNIEKKKKIP